MIIYVLSKLNNQDVVFSGRDILGYYSNLTNAYNKLKKYINDIPDMDYVNRQIERNGYYDIPNDYYTSHYRIAKETLDK